MMADDGGSDNNEDFGDGNGTHLSFMDGYATTAFEGLDGIDPEQVFTLSNAMRWLKTYGGDVSTLQTSIKMRQGNDLTGSNRRRRAGDDDGENIRKEYECEFKGRQYYRIPYRNWVWGNKDLAGLNRSYFPWCEDPLISFIKHDVLCIKREHQSEKQHGYTICEKVANATPSVANAEPGATLRRQRPGVRKVISIKETFIKNSMSTRDLKLMQELRRHTSTNDMATMNFFTLDSLDVPDNQVIDSIIKTYNDPEKSPFKTQLTADRVKESVQACLNKKHDGLSALSQNNSVLMLHERLSNIFELVIEEKVKEDVAPNLQGGSCNTITPKLFDGRGIFSDQFQRYCNLRGLLKIWLATI